MRTQRADQHLAALDAARECVELGAYHRTVCAITGLKPSLVRELFYPGEQLFGPRAPVSTEWLFRRNLTAHVHVSLVAAIFSELVERGFPLSKAMTGAYRLYRARVTPLGDRDNTLDFNRAFVFVRHTFGLWGASQTLHLVACRDCKHRYVDAHAHPECSTLRCPLCMFRKRAERDVRVRSHLDRLSGPPISRVTVFQPAEPVGEPSPDSCPVSQ